MRNGFLMVVAFLILAGLGLGGCAAEDGDGAETGWHELPAPAAQSAASSDAQTGWHELPARAAAAAANGGAQTGWHELPARAAAAANGGAETGWHELPATNTAANGGWESDWHELPATAASANRGAETGWHELPARAAAETNGGAETGWHELPARAAAETNGGAETGWHELPATASASSPSLDELTVSCTYSLDAMIVRVRVHGLVDTATAELSDGDRVDGVVLDHVIGIPVVRDGHVVYDPADTYRYARIPMDGSSPLSCDRLNQIVTHATAQFTDGAVRSTPAP